MPEISVIVPVYKVEKYLDKCVQSIADQTFTDIEIILVDDGSPDACPAMCDAWAARDGRIKVIHQSNQGPGAARNAALDVQHGQYVTFVDSDDYLDNDMLSVLYTEARTSDADIVVCDSRKVTEDQNVPEPKSVVRIEQRMEVDEEGYWDLFATKLIGKLSATCHKLIRAEAFKEVRFPGKILNEDYYAVPDIVQHCKKFVLIPYVGYNRVWRPGSTMYTGTREVRLFMTMGDIHRAAYFRSRGWYERAEGALTDAILFLHDNKAAYDLSAPGHRKTFAEVKRDLICEYKALAVDSKNPSLRVRSLTLRLGLPVFFWYDALVKRLKNR